MTGMVDLDDRVWGLEGKELVEMIELVTVVGDSSPLSGTGMTGWGNFMIWE